MRKSPPFKRKKYKNGETGGGYKQCGWSAVADGLLWGNEMIIRVLTGKWTAIVALMLGVIIDFLLCWLGFITLRLCQVTAWYPRPAQHPHEKCLTNIHLCRRKKTKSTKAVTVVQKKTFTDFHARNYFQGISENATEKENNKMSVGLWLWWGGGLLFSLTTWTERKLEGQGNGR